jgi:hypothetical protein
MDSMLEARINMPIEIRIFLVIIALTFSSCGKRDASGDRTGNGTNTEQGWKGLSESQLSERIRDSKKLDERKKRSFWRWFRKWSL